MLEHPLVALFIRRLGLVAELMVVDVSQLEPKSKWLTELLRTLKP